MKFTNEQINDVRFEIEQVEQSDSPYFEIDDLIKKCKTLEGQSRKFVDALLFELWRDGISIYAEGLGTDGTHAWRTGYKPAPPRSRKKYGR